MAVLPPIEKPNGLIRGTVAPAILILTSPDIRTAELLTAVQHVETADGSVRADPGNILVAAYDGEHYPIQPSVFFGTYDVIASVGNRFIARRLIHVRRAWSIVSDDASFSYSLGRGTIPAARGNWIYQSDDDDFGIINEKVQSLGHSTVCSARRLFSADWQTLLRRRATYLAMLPAVLSLLALLALASSQNPAFNWAVPPLLSTELILLVGGAATAFQMKSQKWALRAAAQVALCSTRAYQLAVALLGHRPSNDFPGMAIWRAAQMPPIQYDQNTIDPDNVFISQLKAQLGKTLHEAKEALARNRTRELVAGGLMLFALLAIICSNIYLIAVHHSLELELFAIWLPALIASAHSIVNRNYLLVTSAFLTEHYGAISFLQSRLYFLTPDDKAPSMGSPMLPEFQATLQALCRAVGTYTQRRLSLAVKESPHPPV